MATLFIARFDHSLKWCTSSTVVIWLVPRETAVISAHVPCTPYNHIPVYSVILFVACFRFFLCTVPNVVSGLSLHSTEPCFSFFFLSLHSTKLCFRRTLCAIPNIVSDMIVSLLLYNTKLCFRRASFHVCSVKYHFRHANLTLSKTKPCFRYTDSALY